MQYLLIHYLPRMSVYMSILCIGIALHPVSAQAEIEIDPDAELPVEELHKNLIEIMQAADSKDYLDRYTQMKTVIDNSFNTPLIARIVLGRHWKTMDESGRDEFISLFKRLTVSTYVSRFDSFNDQVFRTESTDAMKKNRYMIKTKLLSAGKDPVSLNYIVQAQAGDWKIVSVIANGVNDLSLKRAEYASMIKNQGYAALLASLERKISDLQDK